MSGRRTILLHLPLWGSSRGLRGRALRASGAPVVFVLSALHASKPPHCRHSPCCTALDEPLLITSGLARIRIDFLACQGGEGFDVRGRGSLSNRHAGMCEVARRSESLLLVGRSTRAFGAATAAEGSDQREGSGEMETRSAIEAARLGCKAPPGCSHNADYPQVPGCRLLDRYSTSVCDLKVSKAQLSTRANTSRTNRITRRGTSEALLHQRSAHAVCVSRPIKLADLELRGNLCVSWSKQTRACPVESKSSDDSEWSSPARRLGVSSARESSIAISRARCRICAGRRPR